MKLQDEWKKILKEAWSVRLIVLSGLLSALEGLLPLYSDAIPRGIFAGLSVIVGIGALGARVIVQKETGTSSND